LAAAVASLLILCVLIRAWVAADILAHVGQQRGDAKQRARALLKEWLSPAQLALYESAEHFEVVGSHTGKRYRIRRGRYMNIDELDERGKGVAVLCFGPAGYLPVADVMLAQKIAL
jgi:hypothetical protein